MAKKIKRKYGAERLEKLCKKHNLDNGKGNQDIESKIINWLENRGLILECVNPELDDYVLKDANSNKLVINSTIYPLGAAYIEAIEYAEKNRLALD